MISVPSDSVMMIVELPMYLQLSRSTLCKLSQTSKLPDQKVTRRWWVRKETIDRWLDENREGRR